MIFIYQNSRVIIKNPELRNNYRIPMNVQLDMAMDGTQYSYFSPTKKILQTWNFKGLFRNKIEEVFTFLKTTMGKTITVTDHNNQNWSGRFLVDSVRSIDESINSSTLTLTFEGVRI